ncbi:MAG TPA: beta-ketoacyl synthase N-terminal-like domain-containing protein, partial [Polyangiaceae bacterium]|nr:beta-ketoacyl synthase N-terminal-like domain-containing protein [Polyangiaceae bacterium]
MGERKRVAITAIGLVTPLGIGTEASWQRLTEGASGVRRITLFDASSSRVQIAGEVAGFEPRRFLDFKDTQRLARVGQLAVAAAELALGSGALVGLERETIGT